MQTLPRKPESTPEAEAELVRRAIDGEEAAVSLLYRRHAAYIAGLVYRTLGDDGDLDDIVQETFVEGLRQLHTVADRSKVRAFLVTIAIRRIHRRLSWRYRVKQLVGRLLPIAPTVSDPAMREEVSELYRVLGGVHPKYRVAWVLHRVEGFTLPEAAERCGASLATVKRWIAQVDAKVEDRDASR
jgi:RNA polymerase sigma-70 factor (ECF subfamily)